jgi:type IV secretory pathway protease TraF
VLAGLSACGLAALAWASFVHPLPRLIYNPSDSVAVGWYRVDPLGHGTGSLPRPLSVGSIVLTRCRQTLPRWLRSAATCRRACRCSSAWARSRRRRCASLAQVRIDGVPSAAVLPADRWAGRCHPGSSAAAFEPGELFLLSVTNPASFDSRYFGPVSASAVIGVAHPVWLESRP